MVAAHPVETLDLGVGILDVVDEPVRRRRVRGVARSVLLLLLRDVGERQAIPARELPALRPRRRIVGMLHVAAALEHEGPEPLLGQLFGCPAPADAGSDDDGVVGMLRSSRALDEHVAKDTQVRVALQRGAAQTLTAFRVMKGSPDANASLSRQRGNTPA